MTDIAVASRASAPRARARRHAVTLCLGVAVVMFSVALSLSFGSRPVSVSQIVEGIALWLRGQSPAEIGAIAVQSRIPRTVLSLVGGAALALSGALMQAITRNPLADPGILGVNTGAALAVVTGIAFLGISTPVGHLGLALVGAAVTALFVFLVGSLGAGGSTPIKLALAGAATTAALSSLVAAILIPRQAVIDEFRHWQVGDVGRAEWGTMVVIVPIVLVSGVIALLCASPLNTLALGDDVAVGLGVNVRGVRVVAAVAGVTLCAAVTSVAGPIGFVGLVVPHVVRLLVGSDLRRLLPLSALGGATLLTLADTVGRVIGFPAEIEAGIVTAFLGAPVLIVIARRTRWRAV